MASLEERVKRLENELVKKEGNQINFPIDATSKSTLRDHIWSLNGSTREKGVVTLSTAPVSQVVPIAVGDNDTRVPTQGENDALVGNNTDIAVGSGNTFVTQTGLQDGQEIYAADAEASDTYVITLSPVPAAYETGMVIHFKANTANTGACTLNVNSLGAKSIKKNHDQDPEDNDIESGQIVTVVYDGTNFQMQSQLAQSPPNVDVQTFTSSGTWTKPSTVTSTSVALVQAWGGGGGGAFARDFNDNEGAGGGGGYKEFLYQITDLGSTETVTIGAGGTGGITGPSDTQATAGGNTTFGSLLTAYGGGAGVWNSNNGNGGGGGGGGVQGIGGDGTTGIPAGGGSAGKPIGTAGFDNNFGGGEGGDNASPANNSVYGGGGGGGGSSGTPGNSVYGGGGGASGPNVAGGTSEFGGAGGNSGNNGAGSDGAQPGGGGGAADRTSGGPYDGGDGGAGQVIVTTYL